MPRPRDDDEPANPVTNRDSRDAPNTRLPNAEMDVPSQPPVDSPGGNDSRDTVETREGMIVGGTRAGTMLVRPAQDGHGKASPGPESPEKPVRTPRKPRKPRNPVPTGAILSLIAHCQKTCDAKRKGKKPWTYLENAVIDVKKWISTVNEVL